jgi:hypothetical protein
VCIWLKCPLDCHETSTLFASVSAKRRCLNWFRGNLKGSLRRDLTAYCAELALVYFSKPTRGPIRISRASKCLLLPMHRYHEPIRFHQVLVGHGSQAHPRGLIPTSPTYCQRDPVNFHSDIAFGASHTRSAHHFQPAHFPGLQYVERKHCYVFISTNSTHESMAHISCRSAMFLLCTRNGDRCRTCAVLAVQ